MEINEMTRDVHWLAKEKGWWRDELDPEVRDMTTLSHELVEKKVTEKLFLAIGELAEAGEEYRTNHMVTYWPIPEFGNLTEHDVFVGLEDLEMTQLIERVVPPENHPFFFSQGPALMRSRFMQYVIQNYKPEGFNIEMADAVIRIADLMEALGLNLEAAIKLKHNYNKTRPYRHGGKRA